jgi:hypothetical protein
MTDTLQIVVSSKGSGGALDTLTDTLKSEADIVHAGSASSRGMDPGSVMVWVQVASGVLGAVATAMPIVEKIIKVIRGNGISGATIKLPNGAEVSVDNASTKDVERLILAAQQPNQND